MAGCPLMVTICHLIEWYDKFNGSHSYKFQIPNQFPNQFPNIIIVAFIAHQICDLCFYLMLAFDKRNKEPLNGMSIRFLAIFKIFYSMALINQNSLYSSYDISRTSGKKNTFWLIAKWTSDFKVQIEMERK